MEKFQSKISIFLMLYFIITVYSVSNCYQECPFQMPNVYAGNNSLMACSSNNQTIKGYYCNPYVDAFYLTTFNCFVNLEKIGIVSAGPCGCINYCYEYLNRGKCINNKCICNSGWKGIDCSSIDCSSNNCSQNGKCLKINGTETCLCNENFTGQNCSQKLDYIPQVPNFVSYQQYSDWDEFKNQNPLFLTDDSSTIKVSMSESDYKRMLNPLNMDNSTYINSNFFFINKNTSFYLENVGIRIKGSLSRLFAKKSWYFKFDTVEGRKKIKEMSCSKVYITSEVFAVCVQHALTTEREEVMGLLLGDCKEEDNGLITTIWAVQVLQRIDKRKDRVEVSDEQIIFAQEKAEKLTKETGRYTRVIGWYHSHPHITIHPSHIDLGTQKNYQQLHEGFVGLIFSCFDESNQTKKGSIQVIAFQTVNSRNEITNIKPTIRENVQKSNEKSENSPKTEEIKSQKSISINAGPWMVLSVDLETTHLKDISSNDYKYENSRMMSEQEFITSTIHETNNSGLYQKNIPLSIVPPFDNSENTLNQLTYLQSILMEEDKNLFINSLSNQKEIHPFSYMYSTAVYQKQLVKLIEFGCVPLHSMFQQRLEYNKRRIEELEELKKKLSK
eukprot:TRINITY_DN7530_c0_g1_i1.p1 TRINITY_DN7530_c0_g1~~TRINITY_DN7530_c0_g1_i1.p1  ORF type:complete len:613 (+),score=131.94 TRINITY_DN7530_c0_g1_i1:31-1869(+)